MIVSVSVSARELGQAPPQAAAQTAVLYQDARWPWSGRLLYLVCLLPLWLLGVFGSLVTGSPGTILLVTAAVLLPIALCEWRIRKMGLLISGEGIELVGAINRTAVSWDHVDGFVVRKVGGPVDYGERKIRVTRIGGPTVTVPTVALTPEKSWWRWWFSRTRLKWSGGETSDVVGFLHDQLAKHRGGVPA